MIFARWKVQNCLTVSEMVMQLLGWKILMGDAKRFPFEKKFQILGGDVLRRI